MSFRPIESPQRRALRGVATSSASCTISSRTRSRPRRVLEQIAAAGRGRPTRPSSRPSPRCRAPTAAVPPRRRSARRAPTSSSSSSDTATESGAVAASSGPSGPSTAATRDRSPPGSTTTSSPTRTTPPAICPAYARCSPERITYWTGNRSGPSATPPATGAVSRKSSSVGPRYQSICVDRSTTLSPTSADIGMQVISSTSSRPAHARKSAQMRRNTSCSYATRSILLTASTIRGIRSSPAIAACRRLCVNSPSRASTSTTATSAVEAPVTMLRVYWAWPGVSAMMNRRRGVEKCR